MAIEQGTLQEILADSGTRMQLINEAAGSNHNIYAYWSKAFRQDFDMAVLTIAEQLGKDAHELRIDENKILDEVFFLNQAIGFNNRPFSKMLVTALIAGYDYKQS